MPEFSQNSKRSLETCHQDIILVCNYAIQAYDFSVLCGHRGKERQSILYREGKSQLEWPHSKHNKEPSNAVDLVPYPIDWKDSRRFVFLAGIFMMSAHTLRRVGAIQSHFRWGGNWDMDEHLDDNKFDDLGHFERVIPEGNE